MTETNNVLLVEDNPTDARLIEEYITEQAWPAIEADEPTLQHAERLESALDVLDDQVDVVLLDLGLPDSSGFETLDTMLDASGDEPVVVLTGLDDQGVGVEAVERGAQDFLVKDEVTPKLLQQTLRYAIERERQQRELERRNEELALLNQIVRHDIRNDVTIISGWGDMLDEHVDPAGEDYLDRIMDAATHITGLTDTVGDFLEVLENDREPELRPLDVGRLLDAEIEKARTAHESATFERSDDISGNVRVGATELLSSVFRNLLKNAVIHNDEDVPEVVVRTEERPETVVVSIADNGPGVPDSQKNEIFGRGEMGLQSPGSGIGLYLVDTLVGMYGGEVRVEDNDPKGSVFVVELPKWT